MASAWARTLSTGIETCYLPIPYAKLHTRRDPREPYPRGLKLNRPYPCCNLRDGARTLSTGIETGCRADDTRPTIEARTLSTGIETGRHPKELISKGLQREPYPRGLKLEGLDNNPSMGDRARTLSTGIETSHAQLLESKITHARTLSTGIETLPLAKQTRPY